MRRLLTELMEFDDVATFLAEKVAGTGIRYDVGEGPALLGSRLRDLPVDGGRLYERMRAGRGLLVDATGTLSVTGWADRVERAEAPAGGLPAPAVLLRPDGHVVWLGDDQSGLEARLAQWFGAPGA